MLWNRIDLFSRIQKAKARFIDALFFVKLHIRSSWATRRPTGSKYITFEHTDSRYIFTARLLIPVDDCKHIQ